VNGHARVRNLADYQKVQMPQNPTDYRIMQNLPSVIDRVEELAERIQEALVRSQAERDKERIRALEGFRSPRENLDFLQNPDSSYGSRLI
jgi:hypothetical protein